MGERLTRRAAEARLRAEALISALDGWRALSVAGGPLEKHHSQIGRIATVIAGLLAGVTAALKDPGPADFKAVRAVEEQLLTVHTIWEFFRAKLAQRLDERLREHLRLCDAFAWRCYQPARDRYLATYRRADGEDRQVKEPPLVFLNAGWSPFAMGRDAAFKVERAAGGWLTTADFREVLERLPVPVIGLPWYQVAHLPDLLVIAHEAGHVVEWDFGLRAELQAAIAGLGLPPRCEQAWMAWQPEVFADLYGCLIGGAAFAAVLVDFVAEDETKVRAERRGPSNWGDYPPAWLRVRLLCESLRALGVESDYADRLDADWKAVYGTALNNPEFADYAEPVAKALLDCNCGSLGVSVRKILPTRSPGDRAAAESLRTGRPVEPGQRDIRVLLGAARWAWEDDRVAYVDKKLDTQIRTLVPYSPGTLAGQESPAGDQGLGEALFDVLFGGHGDPGVSDGDNTGDPAHPLPPAGDSPAGQDPGAKA